MSLLTQEEFNALTLEYSMGGTKTLMDVDAAYAAALSQAGTFERLLKSERATSERVAGELAAALIKIKEQGERLDLSRKLNVQYLLELTEEKDS